MNAAAGLTGYDLVIIAFFVLLVVRGIWVGFLKQITGLLALYLAYIAAAQYHDRIFPFLKDISTNPKVVFFAAYAILFAVVYVAVMLIGKGLAYVMKLTISGWFDKMLGGLLGAAKALLLIVIVHMILILALPPKSPMLTACRTCNALNKTTVLAMDLIKEKGMDKVFDTRKTAITAREVKDFFATPPKAIADPTQASPSQPAAAKASPSTASAAKGAPVKKHSSAVQ